MELLVEPQMAQNLDTQQVAHAQEPSVSDRTDVQLESSKTEKIEETPAQSLFVMLDGCPSSDDQPAESEVPSNGEAQPISNMSESIDLPPSISDSSSDSVLSASSAPSASNSPIVTMACVVCGNTIEMPSYTALARKCYMKCSGCNPDETHAKNWLDIILTALYNLEVLHKRKYFHCKNEICTFIDRHWSDICPERARTPTWGNTIMSQISTHPELFVSHQRGSGYWALKRKHFRQKKAEAKGRGTVEEDGTTQEQPGTKKREDGEKGKQEGEEGFKEFLVETIIAKRIMGGTVQYLLKWEGFASTENSWETAQDLNCPELIQDFETRSQRPALWKNNPKRKRKSSDVPLETSEKEGEKGATADQKVNPLGLSAHANKRQRARVRMIPVTQFCHQCKERKPVIVFCNRCQNKYCEHCLEKFYDEDILEIQRMRKADWFCPACRGFCSCQECCNERGEPFVPRAKPRERVVSKIIARCRQEGTKEWEYLVHFKGCSSAKNTWIVSRSEIPPDLLRKYKNSLKLRINKNKELPEQKNKKRPSSGKSQKKESKRSSSNLNLRSPGLNKRGLRTSDFDITRVIFEDPSPKIVVPKKQEVLTPAWRIIQEFALNPKTNTKPQGEDEIRTSRGRPRTRASTPPIPAPTSATSESAPSPSNTNNPTVEAPPASTQSPSEGPENIVEAPSAVSIGPPSCLDGFSSVADAEINAVHSSIASPQSKSSPWSALPFSNDNTCGEFEDSMDEEERSRLVSLRSVELEEGSSSEDTSDEAYAKRHARYETKLPLLLEMMEPPHKRPSTPKVPKKATPRKKGGNIRDSGELLSQSSDSVTPSRERGKKRKSERSDRKSSSKQRRKSEEGMGPKNQEFKSEGKTSRSNTPTQQQSREDISLTDTDIFRVENSLLSSSTTQGSLISNLGFAADTNSAFKPSSTPLLDSGVSMATHLGSLGSFSPGNYLSPLSNPTPSLLSPPPPPPATSLHSGAPHLSPTPRVAPIAQYGVSPPAPPSNPKQRNVRRMSTGGTGSGLPSSYTGGGQTYNTLSMTTKQHPSPSSSPSHGPPSANAFYAPPPSQHSSSLMYQQQSFGNSFSPVVGGNGMMPPPSTPYVSPNASAPYNQFS